MSAQTSPQPQLGPHEFSMCRARKGPPPVLDLASVALQALKDLR